MEAGAVVCAKSRTAKNEIDRPQWFQVLNRPLRHRLEPVQEVQLAQVMLRVVLPAPSRQLLVRGRRKSVVVVSLPAVLLFYSPLYCPVAVCVYMIQEHLANIVLSLCRR